MHRDLEHTAIALDEAKPLKQSTGAGLLQHIVVIQKWATSTPNTRHEPPPAACRLVRCPAALRCLSEQDNACKERQRSHYT